jgi:hypothetical protein
MEQKRKLTSKKQKNSSLAKKRSLVGSTPVQKSGLIGGRDKYEYFIYYL